MATLASQTLWQAAPVRHERCAATVAPLRAAELGDPVVGLRNVCLLRLLERVGLRFADAGIPLMVLKGAALNLTVYVRPDRRPMSDLDVMVHPQDAERACALLAEMGCTAGRPLVRGDFFPKFHYERDFLTRGSAPMRIDLHVRPFRPVRYARTVPAHAFWWHAQRVRIGAAEVLVPDAADMLLHLAVHSAVHGNSREVWLRDLADWTAHFAERIDWAQFLTHACDWGLLLPAREALVAAEKRFGALCPASVAERLAAHAPGWRERRVLRQAPHDTDGAMSHVLTDALCAPGLAFKLGYLRAMLLPDRAHMAEWYDPRHPGWLSVARGLRLASPLLRRWPGLWKCVARTDVRETAGGPGVFARRLFVAGERVFSSSTRSPGKAAYVRHSCTPNARRDRRGVVALKFIAPGEEVRIDHGVHACDCRRAPTDASDWVHSSASCHD